MEKEPIKVKLSTCIILIILVVAVALGVSYYYINNEKFKENLLKNENTINNTEINLAKNEEVNESNVTDYNATENNVNSTENNTRKEEIVADNNKQKVIEILNRKENTDGNLEELRVEKISFKNNEYKLTLKHSEPIVISEKKYKKMKSEKIIEIKGKEYSYRNNQKEYKNGTIIKDNMEYEVIKYDSGYAFNLTGLAGSGVAPLTTTEEITLKVDSNTKIYDAFNEKEYKLKDKSSNKWFNKSLEDTLVYLQYNESKEIMIYIDNK